MPTKEEPTLSPLSASTPAQTPISTPNSAPLPTPPPSIPALRKPIKSPRRGLSPSPRTPNRHVDVAAAHTAAAAAAAAAVTPTVSAPVGNDIPSVTGTRAQGTSNDVEMQTSHEPASMAASGPSTPPLKPASAPSPDSPCSSSARKGKGGRKAANPHLTEEERRRERVLKNRESAMKSLQKKKRYTEDLEHRALMLANRNTELKEKIRLLLSRLNSMNISNGPITPAAQIPASGANGINALQGVHAMQGAQSINMGINLPVMQGVQDFRAFAQGQQPMKTSRSFCQMDEWAPSLDIPTPAPLPASQFQQGMPVLGESFMSGVNLSSLGLPNVVPSPIPGLPVSEGGFLQSDAMSGGVSVNVSEKISAGFDVQHMTCSQ